MLWTGKRLGITSWAEAWDALCFSEPALASSSQGFTNVIKKVPLCLFSEVLVTDSPPSDTGKAEGVGDKL
jgi:hypothetical protein